jgi:hypothetical protein
MWTWFTFWLFLHVLAAIVAFGPALSFGLISAEGAKDPANALFSTHLVHLLSDRITIPFALSMVVSGVGLIFSGHVDLWGSEWLLISIVVYIAVVGVSVGFQRPITLRLIETMRSMPPGPPPEGASGPPPQIAALVKKLQAGGIFLSIGFFVILLMMIWRPGAAFS